MRRNGLGMLGILGTALLLVGTSTPAVAQAVVVRSTGPSAVAYPKGKRLAANATVVLKAGDVVTVLDKAGTRVLKGAGSFTLDNARSEERRVGKECRL